jgi:hypothetical protein
MSQGDGQSRTVYFEFVPFGNVMRVTAIDAQTGVEAVIAGQLNAPKPYLQQLALKRLNYILKKQSQ